MASGRSRHSTLVVGGLCAGLIGALVGLALRPSYAVSPWDAGPRMDLGAAAPAVADAPLATPAQAISYAPRSGAATADATDGPPPPSAEIRSDQDAEPVASPAEIATRDGTEAAPDAATPVDEQADADDKRAPSDTADPPE